MGGSLSCSALIQKFVDFWHDDANKGCREAILEQICHTYGNLGVGGDQTKNQNCLESSGFHLFELNTASTTYGVTTEEAVFAMVIVIVIGLALWQANKRCRKAKKSASNVAGPTWERYNEAKRQLPNELISTFEK